ncbi:MAG: RHH-type proline utilization regulon transcriptional repressor/proline dehydrogenase, partial [Halieaceae bacterium]
MPLKKLPRILLSSYLELHMLFEDSLVTESATRQKIRDFYRIDEDLAVESILPDAEVNMRARSRA